MSDAITTLSDLDLQSLLGQPVPTRFDKATALRLVVEEVRIYLEEFFGESLPPCQPSDFWADRKVIARINDQAEDEMYVDVYYTHPIPLDFWVDQRLRCLGYLPFTGCAS